MRVKHIGRTRIKAWCGRRMAGGWTLESLKKARWCKACTKAMRTEKRKTVHMMHYFKGGKTWCGRRLKKGMKTQHIYSGKVTCKACLKAYKAH